jgi:hypothetical protein
MMKGWKNIFQENGSPKQVGIAIPIYVKVDIKPKLVRRDKEIKGIIHQEEIIIVICVQCWCTQLH